MCGVQLVKNCSYRNSLGFGNFNAQGSREVWLNACPREFVAFESTNKFAKAMILLHLFLKLCESRKSTLIDVIQYWSTFSK